MEFFNHGRLLLEATNTVGCSEDCNDKCPDIPKSTENQSVSPLVIIIVATLGTCFLLVSYYAIIVKYCSFWNRTGRRSQQIGENTTHQDFIDEEHGPVNHPIWNITTIGLEQAIIDSITICKYKGGDGLVEGNDCSICLSEFEEDESLRLLPKCSHAFHLPCIDTWLRSHKNCPLCRAPIVSAATEATANTPNLNSSSPQEESQIENPEREDSGVDEMGGENEENERREMEMIKEDSVPRMPSDLAEKHGVQGNEMQPMRRSVSMDFTPTMALAISLRAEAEESSGVQAERAKKSKARLLQKAPISRSFSSGARFLLSRHSRNQSSILPL